jgi:hypothetical protein
VVQVGNIGAKQRSLDCHAVTLHARIQNAIANPAPTSLEEDHRADLIVAQILDDDGSVLAGPRRYRRGETPDAAIEQKHAPPLALGER